MDRRATLKIAATGEQDIAYYNSMSRQRLRLFFGHAGYMLVDDLPVLHILGHHHRHSFAYILVSV